MVDNPLVKKALTHKSGQFLFSRRFEHKSILRTIIDAKARLDSVASLPILPGWAAQLEADLIRRSIFGTAAIEGNPLSETQVGDILEDGLPPQATQARAEREIRNLKAAYAKYSTPPAPGEAAPLEVAEVLVKDINRTVTEDLDYKQHSPGLYRDHRVEVGDAAHGGTYLPPRMKADIAQLMGEFTTWINSPGITELDVTLRAALAHYHLALIHPFADGNGRTARLLEVAILARGGLRYVPKMLSNFYYRNMDDYFIAFSESERGKDGDITPFLRFFAQGFQQSVEEIQTLVHGFIRALAVQTFFDGLRRSREITQRQADLLHILFANPDREFGLKDLLLDPLFAGLYRRASERTARRDIQRLEELKCLLKVGDKYRLNGRVLG